MKTLEYNNIIYVIGQNAKDNWNILDLYKKENDKYIWFHLNSFSSPYIIMCCSLDNLEISQINNYLNFGAQLCKNNSKYRNLPNLKIIYTSLKKLTKTDKLGEVIISGKKKILSV